MLSVDGLTYAYPSSRGPALRGVTLDVEPGEFVVLAGGSGSGKSTLLRAAAGLVPHFHGGTIAGRVEVGGLDTRECGPAEIAAVAGTLFQDPETQVVMGTVRAELAFPLENQGWTAAAVARGVEEAALALGIAALLDRSTHELSGGELQRVALGAALAGRPSIVLLDEPTSQLDPVAGDELLGVLRRINEEWGTTVLLAEHRLERCLAAADRVVALRDGMVACDAAPEPFLEWAAREAPGLQTPASRLFAAAGLAPLPAGVKDARRGLARAGVFPSRAADAGVVVAGGDASDGSFAHRESSLPDEVAAGAVSFARRGRSATGRGAFARRGRSAPAHALDVRDAWVELRDGPAILRGASLAVRPGERVALMGRNGAGKSTLLRVAAGLRAPTRGRVATSGRVALLLQHPGDYFLRDRVGEEVGAGALAAAGLAGLADRHPRDLSGGERQRLALAIVLQGAERPTVAALDEPTRGMDRTHADALTQAIHELSAAGTAVLVATHDAEFAAAWAERVVLLGDGRPVADGSTHEVLGGGWYFATQTARILDGAALLPEAGAALIDRARAEVPT